MGLFFSNIKLEKIKSYLIFFKKSKIAFFNNQYKNQENGKTVELYYMPRYKHATGSKWT